MPDVDAGEGLAVGSGHGTRRLAGSRAGRIVMRSRAAAWVVAVRLTTGLILLTYVTTHLANHSLGLISLGAMEAGREWFLTLWRSPLGTLALYGALLTHVLLALWSLYRRRTLRMPRWEASQLLLGLAIPPLLAGHIVANRVAHEWFGATDSYTRVVLGLWHLAPAVGLRQAVVVVVAWLHACVGIHFWLRLRPWYPRAVPALAAFAVLLPVLALLGFARAGREVTELAARPGWVEATLKAAGRPDAAGRASLERLQNAIVGAFGGALVLVLLARGTRRFYERSWGAIRLTYPGGREVIAPVGYSVLDASRFAGIPHASVCGARGRCSTCRVRVGQGLDSLPPPSPEEIRVLRRVGAPPNVRLACQLRPTRSLAITPVLPADVGARESFARSGPGGGEEREIAVLFADLRGFTSLAEHKLPYDVVFILNRYFETVGGAIKAAGGIANQFTGDGVMALFGVEIGPEQASRQALAAAREIILSVARLSEQLAEDLPEPLRIGIGIHLGPAVVGEMGYAEGIYLTAVGDTVHVASRLEQLTKEYRCHLVVSEQVARLAGLDTAAYERHELVLRNRREPLAIRVIPDAESLPRSPDMTARPG